MLTREAYALDLRQFTTWCRARSLRLFAVRRADIESFAANWRPKAGPAPRSPAAHVRRPRVDYESHAAALDRNELGAILVAAGLIRYDRARGSLDRHATYIVAAYVAGAAR